MSRRGTITITAPAGKRLVLGTEYIVANTIELAEQIHQSILQGITTPGYDQYGGATVTLATDGAGTRYVAFCAKKLSNGVFGFYIIDITHGAEVQYSPFCTGRGSISNAGTWIAWKDKDYYWGLIPGFVGYPDLKTQIAALAQQLADMMNELHVAEQQLGGQLAALQQRVTELETALGKVSAGSGLSDTERAALTWLTGWLQPLLTR